MSLLTKIRTLRHVRPAPEPELPDVAHAVAIIMDGNARWARRRSLPIAAGHRAGTKALRRTVEAAIELGVESLAVYAFSIDLIELGSNGWIVSMRGSGTLIVASCLSGVGVP